LKRYRADGIGFVFTIADPFCGIDLDKCRDKNGRIKEASLKLIRHIGSYAEISPSGDGVHIIVKAKLDSSGRRTAGLEVYASGRYFTITGKHLDGTPERIEERQQGLNKLLKERFPSDPETAEPVVMHHLILSDAALIVSVRANHLLWPGRK
jgi:primase-polymerase (primpol)-like protein